MCYKRLKRLKRSLLKWWMKIMKQAIP
uniref:Uncharacterized protein n=1 Tax=Arundo donax TaxID=35708 RepID=A0A0A8Z3F5_ARUDO